MFDMKRIVMVRVGDSRRRLGYCLELLGIVLGDKKRIGTSCCQNWHF